VAACRKPPRGVARVNTTVRGSTVWTDTSFHDPAPGPAYVGSWRTWTVNATSSAVTASPSCQRASRRSTNVQIEPDGSTDQCSARSGTMVPDGPLRTSPENTSPTRSRSAWLRAVNGLTETGRLSTPSRDGRVSEGPGPAVARAPVGAPGSTAGI